MLPHDSAKAVLRTKWNQYKQEFKPFFANKSRTDRDNQFEELLLGYEATPTSSELKKICNFYLKEKTLGVAGEEPTSMLYIRKALCSIFAVPIPSVAMNPRARYGISVLEHAGEVIQRRSSLLDKAIESHFTKVIPEEKSPDAKAAIQSFLRPFDGIMSP